MPLKRLIDAKFRPSQGCKAAPLLRVTLHRVLHHVNHQFLCACSVCLLNDQLIDQLINTPIGQLTQSFASQSARSFVPLKAAPLLPSLENDASPCASTYKLIVVCLLVCLLALFVYSVCFLCLLALFACSVCLLNNQSIAPLWPLRMVSSIIIFYGVLRRNSIGSSFCMCVILRPLPGQSLSWPTAPHAVLFARRLYGEERERLGCKWKHSNINRNTWRTWHAICQCS